MENTLDLKLILKHLSNGTLGENLCINCLKPLRDQFENVFTKVCKYDKEYCFADVLQIISGVTLSDSENYNVCINCFMMASMAYKFYLLSRRSNEIINFYVNELLGNLDQIELPAETKNNTLCISLPEILTETPIYDFNLHAIGKKTTVEKEDIIKDHIQPELTKVKIEKDEPPVTMSKVVEDDNVVVIIQDKDEPLFYRAQPNGILELLKENETEKYMKSFAASVMVVPKDKPLKQRKKRDPMSQKSCSRCSVKYRFISKLQEHMLQQHNVVLYVCKLCKAITEDKQEYHSHLKTHTNIHQCALCNTIFKKRETIIKHLKWHENMKNPAKTENAHICEVCGVILEDEETLRQHYDSKHYKKFTCYYCGRMYKGEFSFNVHIKKHEAKEEARNNKLNPDVNKARVAPVGRQKAEKKQKCMCATCGRYFVDERALMWHQRLHNDERPYACDVCGRSFVSQNRRNQHAVCAHTAPARRCPLCPALFHLRSMVNTHIKKVHLKTHKRRNRISKHQEVFWRTETVPIQELSVDIQNEILELQAARKREMTYTEGTLIRPIRIEGICPGESAAAKKPR